MIVDSSAVIAMVFKEPEAAAFSARLGRCDGAMSAASFVECSIVCDSRRRPDMSRRFDEILEVAGIDILPVDRAQAEIARQAYRDFGKGSGHPAQLNFGDCFAYALAIATRRPLLYTGTDFTATGVDRA